MELSSHTHQRLQISAQLLIYGLIISRECGFVKSFLKIRSGKSKKPIGVWLFLVSLIKKLFFYHISSKTLDFVFKM